MDFFITKKRGAFLTLLIYLIFIWYIDSAVSPAPALSAVHLPDWVFLRPKSIEVIIYLIGMFLLWEIWLWKKWAIFGKLILDIVLIIVSAIFIVLSSYPSTSLLKNNFPETILILIFFFFIQDGLLIWAMKRKWSYFK